MSSRAQGRHRAAVRPITPLSTFATQLQAGAGTAGRRGAVIAASSGLVVSLGVTAADAAPIGEVVQDVPAAAPATEVVAAPAPVPAPVVAEPAQITVPAEVETVSVSAVAGTLVAPPKPKPKPKPVVAPERTAPVSRSAGRSTQRTTGSATDSGTGSAASGAAATGSDTAGSQPAAGGKLSASRENVLAVAARYVGTPYRYGGTSPSGFDCSGFTQYVFAQVGVSLPRTSSAQAASAVRISRDQALPGDLVYKPGHVGIYAGGNLMYDSPTTGKSVSKREIFSSDFGFYRVLDS